MYAVGVGCRVGAGMDRADSGWGGGGAYMGWGLVCCRVARIVLRGINFLFLNVNCKTSSLVVECVIYNSVLLVE